jgi:hypothetical protein
LTINVPRQTKVTLREWLRTGLVRICRVHFLLLAAYAVYIVAADTTQLITPQLVLQRWAACGLLFVGVGIVWYSAHNGGSAGSNYYRVLTYALILFDILFIGFNVYTQRGMASRAVMLFAIPIAVSAMLLNRTALFLTAILSTATYVLAAVKYFVDYFNEGYKAELYIEVGFYSGMFFILAAILAILIRFRNDNLDSA